MKVAGSRMRERRTSGSERGRGTNCGRAGECDNGCGASLTNTQERAGGSLVALAKNSGSTPSLHAHERPRPTRPDEVRSQTMAALAAYRSVLRTERQASCFLCEMGSSPTVGCTEVSFSRGILSNSRRVTPLATWKAKRCATPPVARSEETGSREFGSVRRSSPMIRLSRRLHLTARRRASLDSCVRKKRRRLEAESSPQHPACHAACILDGQAARHASGGMERRDRPQGGARTIRVGSGHFETNDTARLGSRSRRTTRWTRRALRHAPPALAGQRGVVQMLEELRETR